MAVDPLPLAITGDARQPSLIWRRGSQNTHGQFPRARWWLSKSETARIPFLADWPCRIYGLAQADTDPPSVSRERYRHWGAAGGGVAVTIACLSGPTHDRPELK